MGVSKRWIFIFILAVSLVTGFNLFTSTLNDIQVSGDLNVDGLQEPVRVFRDEKGMAYIYAQNEDDLFFAQGFITAQDRLFMMELARLVSTGRLTEVMGDKGSTGIKAKQSDIRMRTIGFHRNGKKHAAILGDKDKNRFQKYVDGVNAYIETCSDELPVELALLGLKPTKWKITDSLAIVYYMGWASAANLRTEIITQLLVEKLGEDKAGELLPLIYNPDDPSGEPLDLRIEGRPSSGIAMQSLLDLFPYTEGNRLRLGSNNWVTDGKLSAGGRPVLANDPHIAATMLPGPLYPIALITPEIRAVGVNGPGFPGMIAGRTEHLAIGVTNGYADTQDLYVETLFSENPDQYLQDNRSFPLEIIKETLKIKDGSAEGGFREEEIDIRLTERGPIITGLFDDLESNKVISLRWSPFETMGESLGFIDLMLAKDVHEARDVLSRLNAIMLNFVLADSSGNIAWQTTSKIPIRARSNGTIPHPVKSGAEDWPDWIPWEEMPHSINPDKGWLGTTNHAVVTRDYPYYYSSHFAPSWRYSRIKELLSQPGVKSVDDHWQFQRDTKNLMAVRIAPFLADLLKESPKTAGIADILSTWDYHDDSEQVAPSVFQVLMGELFLETYGDELGEHLSGVMIQNKYFWQQRLLMAMEQGEANWFDDQRTSEKKESIKDIVIRAGESTVNKLTEQYGSNPRNWTWGSIHQIHFVSILRRSGIGSGLIGGGSYPMPGSSETLHRSKFKVQDSFDTTVFAALRMVIDLGDPDKITAVLPGGVSERLLSPHRTDQIKAFMDGDKLYWWFSDEAISEHAQSELRLQPTVGE